MPISQSDQKKLMKWPGVKQLYCDILLVDNITNTIPFLIGWFRKVGDHLTWVPDSKPVPNVLQNRLHWKKNRITSVIIHIGKLYYITVFKGATCRNQNTLLLATPSSFRICIMSI